MFGSNFNNFSPRLCIVDRRNITKTAFFVLSRQLTKHHFGWHDCICRACIRRQFPSAVFRSICYRWHKWRCCQWRGVDHCRWSLLFSRNNMVESQEWQLNWLRLRNKGWCTVSLTNEITAKTPLRTKTRGVLFCPYLFPVSFYFYFSILISSVCFYIKVTKHVEYFLVWMTISIFNSNRDCSKTWIDCF